MSTLSRLAAPPARGAIAIRRGLSPRLLTAPLFVALAFAAVGNLLTSPDARERFAAFAVSH